MIFCIRHGADLDYYKPRRMTGPGLRMLASRGLVEVLRVALLERKEDIGLGITDTAGCTVLQRIFSCNSPQQKVEEMVKIVFLVRIWCLVCLLL